MKKITSLIILIVSIIFAQNAAEIKINNPGQIVIEIEIDSVWIDNNNIIKTIPGMETFFHPGLPMIPNYKEIFVGLPSNANINVYSSDPEYVANYQPKITEAERAKSKDIEIPITTQYDGSFPNQKVKISAIDKISSIPSSKLEIFPIQIENNKLYVTKSLSIQITWDVKSSIPMVKKLSEASLQELSSSKKLSKPVENVIPDYQFSNNLVKIVLDASDWYKISANELINSGVDISNVNEQSIRLWNREDEIPIHIISDNDGKFNNNDYFIFWGVKNPPPVWADYDNNFYTDENVYWLTWGAEVGRRFSEQNVSPTLPDGEVYKPETFVHTLKIENDEKYIRLDGLNQLLLQTWDVIDHFYFKTQIIVSKPFEFEFELDYPDTLSQSEFKFEIFLRGMTLNHHIVDIKINDVLITRDDWIAKSSIIIDITGLDCSILKNGTNKLSISLSPDNPDLHDLIYLNWYKIRYPKSFITNDDYFQFVGGNNSTKPNEFNISGFTTGDILLVKDKNQILTNFQFINNVEPEENILRFQDSNVYDSIYEVFSFDQLSSVKSISDIHPVSDIISDIDAEYIIVAPDSFFSTLQPLADYHGAAIVDIEKIYRQYSHGILSPYAIKDFFQTIYNKPNSRLQYALIAMVGDYINWWSGTFSKQTSIPVMLIYTHAMGAIICDYWYGSFNDEFWIPELSVGRFPVSNVAELQNVVDKTMNHHTREITNWDNNILMVGGVESYFTFQSEALLNNIKDNGNFISRLYSYIPNQDSTFFGNHDTLKAHLTNGLSYLNFFGHGAGRIWSDNGLLRTNHIKDLNNGRRLPFITSMSCHTGDISYPRALSRLMVSEPDGGALAWYSAAGIGWNWNDYYMAIPLQKLIFGDNDMTIGEIINLSKTQYYLEYSKWYPEIAATQLYQYNLIGDPAIKLKKPKFTNVFVNPKDPEPSEIIELTYNDTNIDSVHLQLFLPDNRSLNKSNPLSEMDSYTLPDTLNKGQHTLNISYKRGDDLFVTSQRFSVSGSFIEIEWVDPSNPTNCDSINVIVKALDRNGISSVQLFVNGDMWSEMISIGEDRYTLERPNLIPPKPSNSTIKITCQVVDANNDTTSNSEPFLVNVYDVPDISPLGGKFAIDDKINMIVNVESKTAALIDSKVELYVFKNNDWESVGNDTINFDGIGVKEAVISGYFPVGVNRYKVVTIVDFTCSPSDDNTVEFSSETNAFWITPELGSTDDGMQHKSIGINGVEIDIPAGIVSAPTILSINKLEELSAQFQPDFIVENVSDDYAGIEIIFDNSSEYNMNWNIGKIPGINGERLYKYFNDLLVWLPQKYSMVNDTTLSIYTKGTAQLAFFNNTDAERPSLNATVNGQKYLKNISFGKTPSLQIDIFDKNGIDARNDSIKFLLNYVESFDLEPTFEGSGNNISLSINPTFSIIDTLLSIIALDAAGNQSDTLHLEFSVSEKLEIVDYGNYPNPFSTNTVLSYELTETSDNLTIAIYTVEGRKIRELESADILTGGELNLAGYHEVKWDGKSQSGVRIGNGTYFYRIIAKQSSDSAEKIGKIVFIK